MVPTHDQVLELKRIFSADHAAYNWSLDRVKNHKEAPNFISLRNFVKNCSLRIRRFFLQNNGGCFYEKDRICNRDAFCSSSLLHFHNSSSVKIVFASSMHVFHMRRVNNIVYCHRRVKHMLSILTCTLRE